MKNESAPPPFQVPADYVELIRTLKDRVREARSQAVLSVNRQMVLLYWTIGQHILASQKHHGWGAAIVDSVAADLQHEFPEIKGFARRNVMYMRALAEAYPTYDFVQRAVAQIPWGQNCTILDKVKDSKRRQWYVLKTIENGWSRPVLAAQIDTDLPGRQAVPAGETTNFSVALSSPQSELALETIKDPYVLDFLMLREDAKERELEDALIQNITRFLLELGVGFAYMGRQYKLEVGGQDYFLDLLFYHHRLRCLVVIELKMDEFKPEYAGKMNFYLNALDDLVKLPEDRPSIGIILCKERNGVVAEYALKRLEKPIGVAEYRLTKTLPADLRKDLPTAKALEVAVVDKLSIESSNSKLQVSGPGEGKTKVLDGDKAGKPGRKKNKR